MSLVSPQNKLKIEVCTICFKKIRDACFSPPKFGSTENVFFHPPQKRDDSQLTFSTRTYSWQKLNKTVVIFQWIFFVLKGQHHQLLQPVESSSQVDGLTWKMIFHFLSWFFCHSELHQYVWGNSQMPRNNALWKCLFFFCCLFRQWLVYSCYWGPKTNIDRSNNAYSKYARFGTRRGLLEEVCIEVFNLAILNWSRKYIFKKL